VTRKAKDIPLGYSAKDFKAFNSKKPRELMPVMGTGYRRNELSERRNGGYHAEDSQSGDSHIYHHDVESERMRRAEENRRDAALLASIFGELNYLWFIIPYRTITRALARRSNRLGVWHVVSLVLWASVLFHVAGLFMGSDSLLSLVWIVIIVIFSAVIAMGKILMGR
jgi:hypothetical protein